MAQETIGFVGGGKVVTPVGGGGEVSGPSGSGGSTSTCGGTTKNPGTITPSCTSGNLTIGFYFSAYASLPGSFAVKNFDPFANGDQIDTHCGENFCGVQVTSAGSCSTFITNNQTGAQTCQGTSSFGNPYGGYMSSLLSIFQGCITGTTQAANSDAFDICGKVTATTVAACSSVQTCMGYCSTATVTFMGSEMQCPLKVNIAGKDAQLNTNNGLRFILKDRKGKDHEVETSGGLNSDEAWLIADRDGSGNFVNNGVINGKNWFTDHAGQHRDGYQDLLNTFARFIKQDEKGAYIPLHHVDDKIKAQEKVAAAKRALRHDGYERLIDPSLDLKLLDADGNILFASDYFTRVYVTSQEVDEKGKKNVIWERAPVVDINGQTHMSADQWFAPKSMKPLE